MRETGQICSDEEKDEFEFRNAVAQYDEIRRLAARGWAEPGSVAIDAAMVRYLHSIVARDIYDFAGQFRAGPIGIGGTSHKPPPADEVSGLVDEMAEYVADHWDAKPVHLCAYLLWRCNWIHPFQNGNGRTTRGLAYLAFLLRLGFEPGGTPTFIDMISADKFLYYDALDAADAAWAAGQLDLSVMEERVSKLLAKQLVQIVEAAGAKR